MQTSYTNIECVIKNNLLHIVFENRGLSVNTLCSTTLEDLDTILSNVSMNGDIEGVVFQSNKPNCFIAGADINEIKQISDVQDAYAKATVGQSIINKISKLNIPTYAIVNEYSPEETKLLGDEVTAKETPVVPNP